MAKSRLDMRREVEAAEALEKASPTKKAAAAKASATKKAAKKKATRKKATARTRKAKDTPARRRLVWVIYSSTMREEGRFLYHERDKAEEKLEQLLSKGKRRYFIQPIKEALDADGQPLTEIDSVTAVPEDVDEPKKNAKAAVGDDEDGDDSDDDDAETPDVPEDDSDS